MSKSGDHLVQLAAKPHSPVRSILQRKCSCGNYSTAGGECAECGKKEKNLQRKANDASASGASCSRWRLPIMQRKLAIGATNDPLEQEADRVADQILSGQSHSAVSGEPPRIQRFTGQLSGQPETAPASVDRVLASRGTPLEPALQQEMSQRFGHDFSHVRVHTSSAAEESASEVNANAYTVGHNIVFGKGQFVPGTREGRRLIAHELTHVVQQRAGIALRVQRSLAGCQSLLNDPNIVSLLSGRIVHQIIGAHFRRTVAGARGIAIPGASAGPLRTQGLCGGDNKVIDPQGIGGLSSLAGAGIPDLARVTPGRILQVAEIKPAAVPCLIDGEEQMLRYIDQGNARDPEQTAWRASRGVTVVTPMPESAYLPPNFRIRAPGIGNAELKTAWCTPGLLAYSVSASGEPVLVAVPQHRRVKERERLRAEAASQAPALAAGVAATAVTVIAGRALWRHFWRVVIQRFAIRAAIAAGLSLADGPLPFGELVSLGLGVVTVFQIIGAWDEMWQEADQIAAQGA